MHQSMPPDMWSQVDVIYYLAVATILLNYFTFFRRPYTGGRYEVMRVLKDDRTSSSINSAGGGGGGGGQKRKEAYHSMTIFGKG